jgi:hypothetical protein
MFDYAGAIHFHSSYSYDARTPLEQIVEAGAKAGLDFAIVTDHFRLDARQEGWEGYHTAPGLSRRLLMLVGEEISPRYNHYLAFSIQKPIVVWKTQSQAQAVIDAVNAQGGFGFIAHPDHGGAPLVGARAYPWIDWNVTGFTGLSIWDLMGDWISALSSPWGAFYACWRPEQVLRGPKQQTLARWDELSKKGNCFAIGEVDNHGHHKRYFGLRWHLFPFEWAFRTVRTHVLLEAPFSGDAAADQARVLEAVRTGRSYVSLDLWNDPKGFSFEVFDDRQRAGMGQRFRREGPALLEAKTPEGGRFRVIRNGQMIWEEHARPHIERDLDLPGVYRLEVDQFVRGRWRPWIYSNPIWVE